MSTDEPLTDSTLAADTAAVLEEQDTVIAVDTIPTLDQGTDQASYVDWRPQDTRIVVCAIGTQDYPGEFFENRDIAIAAIRQRHGRILEQNFVPGRAFFRVSKKR